MPKKEEFKDKEKILALLEQFDWMFGVQNFHRNLVYKENDETSNGSLKTAEIFFYEDYQELEIDLFPEFFKSSFQDQRKILLHEFCHVITIPSKKIAFDLLDGRLVTPDKIKDVNEEATSKIENLLDQLLRGNLTYAREAYKNYLMPKKKPVKKSKPMMKEKEMKKMKKKMY